MGKTSAINHWLQGFSGSLRHWTPDRPGNCREMGLMCYAYEAFYSSNASNSSHEIEWMLMSEAVHCYGETAVSGIPFLVEKDDYSYNETVAILWNFFELQRTEPSKRRDIKNGTKLYGLWLMAIQNQIRFPHWKCQFGIMSLTNILTEGTFPFLTALEAGIVRRGIAILNKVIVWKGGECGACGIRQTSQSLPYTVEL